MIYLYFSDQSFSNVYGLKGVELVRQLTPRCWFSGNSRTEARAQFDSIVKARGIQGGVAGFRQETKREANKIIAPHDALPECSEWLHDLGC